MRVPFGLFKTTSVELPFISTWRTTAPSEGITLPYEVSGTYSGTIDWGDGNTSVNSYANRTHTYTTAADYIVTITGTTTGWVFNSSVNGPKIRSISQWGTLKISNNGNQFKGCTNLNLSIVSDTLNLTGITNFSSLFQSCTSLVSINNINSWNTSNITLMYQMFGDCSVFNQTLSFDTSNVTSMQLMFNNCFAFNSTVTFNTANVLTMNSMFRSCSVLNKSISLNTNNVNNMFAMFNNCLSFNSTISFTNTSLVTDFAFMFRSATVFNKALSFNTSSATNMFQMFRDAQAFNQALSFNTANVTTMFQMFYNAQAFDQNIGAWNVSNVNDFTDFMFAKTPVTFSTVNLDAIYNGWSGQIVIPNIIITFGTAKYTAGGAVGKAILTSAPNNWVITDGGI